MVPGQMWGDVSHIDYDVLRRKVLEVQPDPGTGGSTAVKTHYDAVGRTWKSEQGFVQNGAFTPLIATTNLFDAVGNKVQENVVGGSPQTVQTLTQFSYDGLNRLVCTAKRLNSLASPPPDACTPGPDGPNGQDQVTQNLYLADGKLKELVVGKGKLDIEFARYEYSPNGQRTAVIDGVNNRTTLTYDGFDRLATQYFPSKTRGANAYNPVDYEAYGYDANGNRISWHKRDGTQFGEINALLNGGFENFATTVTDFRFARALSETRRELGRDIDFSKQSEREAIGNNVMENQRDSCTGTRLCH